MAPDRIWLTKRALDDGLGAAIAKKPSADIIDCYVSFVRVTPELLALIERLKSLLNPDEMHPVGCSSWDAEAHAFLELLAESIADVFRTDP